MGERRGGNCTPWAELDDQCDRSASGHDRKTIRDYLEGRRVPVERVTSRVDLIDRQFTARHRNQLRVALTRIRTYSNWAYAALVPDVFSRT
jgi:hypothetical protein